MKAVAEELANSAAAQAQREAEAAAAATDAAEKLPEIEDHQKQTQQLIRYEPFAKSVVECAEKVISFPTFFRSTRKDTAKHSVQAITGRLQVVHIVCSS